MEIVKILIDLFLHLDKHLASVVSQYGVLSYGLLFVVIFLETGFVITPFLPGDSLLFISGALSGAQIFQLPLLLTVLCLAAIFGDTLNYWIGHFLGPKVFQKQNAKIFKPEYLEKTQVFYAKHGGKTIILARFVPIVRTFAPFVAGIGRMHYGQFLFYNIIGGISWVFIFTLGGFLFGNIPVVKDNFHYVVVLIIAFSLIPILVEYRKGKKQKVSSSANFETLEKTFRKEHLVD